MIWASRSYDQWLDGTCVILVLSVHFPNSISRILQKHSNLLLWAVRSQWTRVTIESTVREHLILSRARKHKVLLQLGCYGDTSLEVVWSEIQWHLSSLCACKQWPNSFGAFLQKNHSNHRGGVGSKIQRLRRACITKASKVWWHMIFLHIGEYDVLLHLRCYGDTSFEVVGYGIKGHLSSFCTNCVQFSNS